MAVYAGMSGAGASLGLLFGGILVQLASWRWVFLVNVPIGVAILVLAPISLPIGDGLVGVSTYRARSDNGVDDHSGLRAGASAKLRVVEL